MICNKYVTFTVSDLLFGIDIAGVQEVLKSQPMTPVPIAPSSVKGLVNLRGQIITAIDMRSIIKIEKMSEEHSPMNVVVKGDGEVVSILVDSIGDVLELKSNEMEETPETISTHLKNIVKGVYKLKNELMLVLNVSSCIHGEKL